MKHTIFIAVLLFSLGQAYSQEKRTLTQPPHFAIKTNALYWATTTPNLGIEFRMSPKWTMDISGNYNPWEFSDNRKFKHWLVQPELRYWVCDAFSGSFWGLHFHYAQYNVGGINLPILKELRHHRYQGWLVGGGISYGYHWILSNHWSVEASLGLGYAYLDYDKYTCEECGEKLGSNHKNYWGPTKASLSIIYIIK